MIYIDTREKPQAITRIIDHLDRNSIPYERRKLDVGDYALSDKPSVAVDRKQTLGELCSNLCSPDKARFWREVRRARDTGVKLYILVEHGGKYRRIEDVRAWHSPYTHVSGRDLMEKIYQCHIAYGVEFLFCRKQDTGKRIMEILAKEGPDNGA